MIVGGAGMFCTETLRMCGVLVGTQPLLRGRAGAYFEAGSEYWIGPDLRFRNTRELATQAIEEELFHS